MFARHLWVPSIDSLALADAQTFLGLVDPVCIEIRNGPTLPEAFYRREGSVNMIGLNMLQSVRELSRSVWHELEHARQCEQLFDRNGSAFHAEAFEQAVSFDTTGTLGALEEMAINAEEYDYEARLIRMVRI
jgi:hypothetical protein